MSILFKKNSINEKNSDKTEKNYSHDLISSLKEGDKSLFKDFYLNERAGFLKWGFKKYSLSDQELSDIYQETMAIFFEKITSGKLSEFTAAPTTYVYAVGKNLILNKLKKEIKHQNSADDIAQELLFNANDQEPSEEVNLLTQKVKSIFEKMEDPCFSILKFFYYENLSIKDITSIMNYKNDSVVKNQKKRCVERIKKQL